MIRAAVLTEPKRPLEILDVELAAPGPGEVRVRVVAAGVCHSDYHYMVGDLPHPLPVVLGHEGAGVIEEVGPGVRDLAVGDHVVLLWRTSCGHCEYCSSGRPALCPVGNAIRASGTLEDGTSRLHLDGGGALYHFLGVSCFAEAAVCPVDGVVKVPDDVPLEVAALCGCSVMTGVGAATNSAKVEPGSTVLVIGAGGVGLSAIMGAQLCGAARIIAADLSPAKLELARQFGATDTVDTSREDLVRTVRKLVGGVETAVEAIGRADTVAQAVRALRAGGTAVAVGIAPPSIKAEVSLLDLVLQEKTLRGSVYGSTRPGIDFPRLFELYRTGRLPLDRLLSHRFRLDQINEAYDALLRGELTRAVVIPG
ncbi:MAG: Zn-dependent alcohol dehydrogenase [Candidatus Dormiibacterota bacterium]